MVAAKLYCPLAFGGLQTKQRVQSVLKYRRPAFALLLAAAVVCGAVAVCFLTDPKEGATPSAGTPEAETPVEPPKSNLTQVAVRPGKDAVQFEIRQSIEDRNLSKWEKEQFYTCLSYMRIKFFDEEKPYTAEIENMGEADGSITFWVRYMTYNQDVLALAGTSEMDFFVDVKIVTIQLPAGEKVRYTFDPGYGYTKRQVLVAGVSYAEISVTDFSLSNEMHQLYKG